MKVSELILALQACDQNLEVVTVGHSLGDYSTIHTIFTEALGWDESGEIVVQIM